MTNLSRREFLRWSSLMGGVTLFAGCQFLGDASPVPKYITGAPASDPPDNLEGVTTVYSVCGLCSGNCGIACRIAQGMLVKIGGNPFNPVSSGKLISLMDDTGKKSVPTCSVCAIGSSGIQTLSRSVSSRQTPQAHRTERFRQVGGSPLGTGLFGDHKRWRPLR